MRDWFNSLAVAGAGVTLSAFLAGVMYQTHFANSPRGVLATYRQNASTGELACDSRYLATKFQVWGFGSKYKFLDGDFQDERVELGEGFQCTQSEGRWLCTRPPGESDRLDAENRALLRRLEEDLRNNRFWPPPRK